MKTSRSNILISYFVKRTGGGFLILMLFLFVSTGQAQENSVTGYRIKKVVIDPGHGGKDPGTLGRYSMEKNIALVIALKLGKYIKQNIKDVQVIYTRKSDVFLELDQRGNIANKNHADLFISIHCNSNPKKTISGAETYVMGLNKEKENMEVARTENSVITLESDYSQHYEGFDPNSTESYILFSLMQNTYLEQSLEFASLVQKQFKERARRIDRGVRQAGFLVLWKTTMPSVLVETGYLSNPREEKYLMSDEGQSVIASAIYRAIKVYKQEIESRSQFSVLPKQDSSDIVFKVQVLASSKHVSPDYRKFIKYPDITEIKDGGRYRYVIGKSKSYEDIKKLKERIVGDFPDAFIIALKGGKIIPLRDALKEKKY